MMSRLLYQIIKSFKCANTESGSIMVDQIKADYAKLYADVGELNISHALDV